VRGERQLMDDDGPRQVRYKMAESPVGVLGRRRDRDGKPFLESDLVEAAERLREDFELAQMGPRVAQNWDRFLTGGDRGGFQADSGIGEGPTSARARVAAALRDLGPGLGDVALRCCCFLEGLEVAERRMGWAARSGKIVLRIALMRLRRHYDETYGRSGPLIG
ncbi:MAG: helix-turn-helix domain containing protein, partial [Rhodobacterales bacterium 17-64-5]